MIICIPVPISFFTQNGHRNIKNDIGMDGDTYDHSLQLHYRQYLVGLLFADLPSISPSLIFILVIIGTLHRVDLRRWLVWLRSCANELRRR